MIYNGKLKHVGRERDDDADELSFNKCYGKELLRIITRMNLMRYKTLVLCLGKCFEVALAAS